MQTYNFTITVDVLEEEVPYVDIGLLTKMILVVLYDASIRFLKTGSKEYLELDPRPDLYMKLGDILIRNLQPGANVSTIKTGVAEVRARGGGPASGD